MKLLAAIAMGVVAKLARVVRLLVRMTLLAAVLALTLLILDALLLRDESPRGVRPLDP